MVILFRFLFEGLYFDLEVHPGQRVAYISCLRWSQRQTILSLMIFTISDLFTSLRIPSTSFRKESTSVLSYDGFPSCEQRDDTEELSMPVALVLTNSFSLAPPIFCCTIIFLFSSSTCSANSFLILLIFSSSSLVNCVISSLMIRISLEMLRNYRLRMACRLLSMMLPMSSVISSIIFWPQTGRLPSTIDHGYFPARSKAKVGSYCFYYEDRLIPSTHRWSSVRNFQLFVISSIRGPIQYFLDIQSYMLQGTAIEQQNQGQGLNSEGKINWGDWSQCRSFR